MSTILALDPGEHTGWSFLDDDNRLYGGTIVRDHLALGNLIIKLHPDICVVEKFNLYPGKAKSLAWNSFYPCEAIGVIKYECVRNGIEVVEQAPSIKKYAGILPQLFCKLKMDNPVEITEHSKDAVQHLCYYLRSKKLNDRLHQIGV